MITVNSNSEFLSEAVFDHFLTRHSELPAWLVRQKQKSWSDYLALPAPHRKMESWRCATVRGLEVDGFRLATPIAENDARTLVERSGDIRNTSGKLVFGNDDLLEQTSLPEELKAF